MSSCRRNGSVPSLPPPQPKSPPRYPDLYGKRRELARVQMLEREIGFLEEELKAFDQIPPASRSCKEVADFVTGNVDPLMPTIKKTRRSCRFWKWICGVCCFDVSWMCCSGCLWGVGIPGCADSMTCSSCSNPCRSCRTPECRCWNRQCFKEWKCSCLNVFCCCSSMPKCSCPSSPTCSCPRCTCNPKCPHLNICSCLKNCCFPCYYCM